MARFLPRSLVSRIELHPDKASPSAPSTLLEYRGGYRQGTENPVVNGVFWVGPTGLEPVASSVSGKNRSLNPSGKPPNLKQCRDFSFRHSRKRLAVVSAVEYTLDAVVEADPAGRVDQSVSRESTPRIWLKTGCAAEFLWVRTSSNPGRWRWVLKAASPHLFVRDS